MSRRLSIPAALLIAGASPGATADGVVVDKIYHPYVDALENELEYRALVLDEGHGMVAPAQLHQLSVGTAVGSHLFAEIYAIGSKSRDGTTTLDAWEAELKWQLTEQGEYAVDWGLLTEYEHGRHADIEEFSIALLAEKEWAKWSAAANLYLINEWGDDIDPEVETVLALQARYRHSRLFEPGVEFFAGQNARGIGPVLQGTFDTGPRQSLHWEGGLIFGIDSDSPEHSWRFLMEYEF